MKLLTVGHSIHTTQVFLDLLENAGVRCLVDVRSVPRSKMNPQFNKEVIEDALRQRGIQYLWLGWGMGGLKQPTPEQWENAKDALTKRALPHGLTALMCSEGGPEKCHRRGVAQKLLDQGVVTEVEHLLPSGMRSPHAVIQKAMEPKLPPEPPKPLQGSLFD